MLRRSTKIAWGLPVALSALASAADGQVVAFATTPNQESIALAIDASPATTPQFNPLRATFATLTPAQSSTALSQLTPGGYSLLPEATLRAADLQEFVLRRYLRDFRAGGAGPSSGDDAVRRGGGALWMSGSQRYTNFRTGTDRPYSTVDSTGVIGGFDVRATGKTLVGVYGGYERESPRFGEFAARSALKSWFAGGYGTLGIGPAYLDLFGSYGQSRYNLRRAVQFGEIDAVTGAPATDLTFAASTRSRTWLAGGTLGLQFVFAGVEVEPFAGLRYANLHIRGFDEGGAPASFAFDQRRYESVLGNFGARLGLRIESGDAVIRPEVRGAWRHEFKRDASAGYVYDFGGATTGPVYFLADGLPRDYAQVGAGLSISGRTSPVSFLVEYNGEFGKQRRMNGITGGVRFAF